MAIPAYLMDKAQQKHIDQLKNRVKVLELEVNNIYKILEKNGIR